MNDDVRVPVKFPGWSQPGVSGLQARILALRKAKRVMRVRYMIAVMFGLCFEVWGVCLAIALYCLILLKDLNV